MKFYWYKKDSKIQIFISEFKDKKVKEKENTIKEKKKIKELEDEIKKLTGQTTQLNQNDFFKLQNMHVYCKICKKHTNTFPKKLILIWKNKIKRKSRCTICLTKKIFIREIEGKYDIESELKIFYFSFLLIDFIKETWKLIAWSVEKILKI